MTTLPGPVVSPDWLAGHLGEVRIVDVRWYLDGRSGHAAFSAGHLPGAVWLDLDRDLSAPPTAINGRHPLPAPEHFAAALGRVGIAAGTPVVAYDDAGGSHAARLWWMLHVIGEPVAVLDGGLDSWARPLTTVIDAFSPTDRPAPPWPAHRFVGADDLERTEAVVYDARTAARFEEGDPAIDPRPGHIPGAVSAPWAGNLDDRGRFRPAAELRARFAAAGAAPAVAYCGSGVTACHDLLAMELAGLGETALYPGSFSQWGADPGRPVTVGAAP